MASNEDRGPMLQRTTLSLTSVAFCVFVARISARLYQKRDLTAADYFISAAMLADVTSAILTSVAIGHDFGKHTPDIRGGLDSLITISICLLGSRMTGIFASALSRISIASLLLSIETARCKRLLLRAIIALQTLLLVTYEIAQLVQYLTSQCHVPKTHCLDPTQKTDCFNPTQALVFSYISIAIWTFSDCICTIISGLLIYRLRRARLERALIMVLMASGLSATLCGIPRIYCFWAYDWGTSDAVWELVPELMWRYVEERLILIAACAPFLKPLVEKGLRRLGVPTFGIPIRELNRASSLTAAEGSAEREWRVEKKVVWSTSSGLEK